MMFRKVKVNKSFNVGDIVFEFDIQEDDMLKLQVFGYGISTYNVDYWLCDDGLFYPTKEFRVGKDFQTETIAQTFLDAWMPQKEWLSKEEVQKAANESDEAALLCSIEHWKQILLDVKEGRNHLGGRTCAICVRTPVKLNVKACGQCALGKTEGFDCCGEYENFRLNRTTENAIKMYNKLVTIYNEKYGERKMAIELTVAEISEKLGYDVKVVKESKYKPQAGDVTNDKHGIGIIVEVGGKLHKIQRSGCQVDSKSKSECYKNTDGWAFEKTKVCTIQDLIDAYEELNA